VKHASSDSDPLAVATSMAAMQHASKPSVEEKDENASRKRRRRNAQGTFVGEQNKVISISVVF